jgi:hypothetical protein
MRKRIEHCYCDKCKKEIIGNSRQEYYRCFIYDLCDKCYEEYTEFKIKTEKLKEQWEKLEKEYQFGEYLPKEKGSD